jgi:hypothetical protein
MLAIMRIRDKAQIAVGDVAPTSGTTGAGQLNAGALYLDITNYRLWKNVGTKASPTFERATRMVTVVAAGRNAAGAVTATGFKVGDTVVSAVNLTDGTDDTANFEAAITVADQIQQSSAANLTTKKYIFQVQR